MPGLAESVANGLLDDLGLAYPFVQMHIGNPGANGSSNVAAESTRVEATYDAASGGVMATSDDLTWVDVPANEEWTHFTAWSAAVGGSFGFSGLVVNGEVTQGLTYVIDAGNLNISLQITD